MQDLVNTPGAVDLSKGPNLKDTELGVHIILCADRKTIPPTFPTDIVVINKQPWHVAGLPGHKREPRAHPDVHKDFPETVLVLSSKQTAVWWSETEFKIISVERSKHTAPNRSFPEASTPAPAYPFATVPPVPPAPPTNTETWNGQVLWVARSTVPVPDAEGHMYKIKFTIGTDEIDPDMYCGGN